MVNAQYPVEIEIRQRPARALGDRTRHGIYRAIAAAPEPVTVAELTATFALNHNAIRQHLAVLCRAGLVIEDLAPPTGPGRRRLRYQVDPGAAAAWDGPNPYEQLAVLLLEVLRGRPARAVGSEAGRRLARARRVGHHAEPLDGLVDLVARQGFAPRLVGAAGDPELVLERCPFAAAAGVDPSVVCELHRGMLEGMADALDGDLAVSNLVVRDPRRAGCRIRLATNEGDAAHV